MPPETKVIDSRLVAEGSQVRRRRECLSCAERFTTAKRPELLLPRVVKQDAVESRSENKLGRVSQGLGKTPCDSEDIQHRSIIKFRLRASGEREVPARGVGKRSAIEPKNSIRWLMYALVSGLSEFCGISMLWRKLIVFHVRATSGRPERSRHGKDPTQPELPLVMMSPEMPMSAIDSTAHQWMAPGAHSGFPGLYTTHPNPRVVVHCQSGKVVGEGWHERAGEPHAEVHALRQAGILAKGLMCTSH